MFAYSEISYVSSSLSTLFFSTLYLIITWRTPIFKHQKLLDPLILKYSYLFLGKLLVDWEPLLESDSLLSLALELLSGGLHNHGLGWLESGGTSDISDLGAIDLSVEFLVVEVEDLLENVYRKRKMMDERMKYGWRDY